MKKLMIIIPMVLLIVACQGTKRAYQAAEGVDENAKVVAEHYYALVKEANDMKKAGTLAGGELAQAQTLVSDTKPVVDQLITTALLYENARTAETEAELNAAISEAAIAISKLIDIIKAARDSSSISMENNGLAQYWPKTTSQIAA